MEARFNWVIDEPRLLVGQQLVTPSTLLAFTCTDADPFAVGDSLKRRGWYVDQQQPPASLHCTVSAANAPVIDDFLTALRHALDEVRTAKSVGTQAAYASTE